MRASHTLPASRSARASRCPHHDTPSLIQPGRSPATSSQPQPAAQREAGPGGSTAGRAGCSLPRGSWASWGGASCPGTAHSPGVALQRPQRWQPRAPWGPTNQTRPPGVRAAASPPASARADGPEDSLITALLNPHGQFGSISINNVESFYLLTGCKSIRENNVKSGPAE